MYKLPEDLDSKYKFVTLASKRAEQLQKGALPRVDEMDARKKTLVAQAEVAQGEVAIYDPEIEQPSEEQLLAEEEEE